MQNSFILTLIISYVLVGCASIRHTEQPLAFPCEPGACQVIIQETGQTFQAPSMQSIERHQTLHVGYKTEDGQSSTQVLKGSVRWFDSVFANSLFALIPGGWVVSALGIATDYYTENIWKLPNPKSPQPTKKQASTKKVSPKSIVIAPIHSNNPQLSESALAPLIEKLQKRFPEINISSYNDHGEAFEAAGWSYKQRSTRVWKMLDLFQALNTTHLAVANLSPKQGQTYQLEIKIYDIITDELFSEESTVVTLQDPKDNLFTRTKNYLSTLLPNSVGISQGQTTNTGMITPENQDQNILMKYYHINSAGSASTNTPEKFFTLSFTNVEPQQGRKFDLVAKLKSDFTISQTTRQLWNNYLITDSTRTSYSFNSTQGPRITTYSIGPGLGPEVGVVGALGYLYLNFIYSLEFQYHQFTGNHPGSMTDLETPLTFNLGYSLAATKHLHFSINGGIKTALGGNSNQLYSRALNEKIQSNFTNQTIYTFSLHYYFPEMRRFARQKLTSL